MPQNLTVCPPGIVTALLQTFLKAGCKRCLGQTPRISASSQQTSNFGNSGLCLKEKDRANPAFKSYDNSLVNELPGFLSSYTQGGYCVLWIFGST